MGTLATATRSRACHWRPPTATPTPLLHPLPPNRAPPQQLTRGGPLFPPRCPWVGQVCPRTAARCSSPWGQCRIPDCLGWRATTPPCFSPNACTAGPFFSGPVFGDCVSRTHHRKQCQERSFYTPHHFYRPTISSSSERTHLAETDPLGFSQENPGGVFKSLMDAKAHQTTKNLWEAKCRVKASFKSLKNVFFQHWKDPD